MWITILNIALAIILFIGILCQHSLKSMFEQIGKNLADIFQNREKEYEAEKGRNIATKEDIEEITEKIEQVKAEISYRNQWEHDHIQKREERLIRLLYLANKIVMSQNRILIKSRNAHYVDDLFSMIDEIDSYAVELSHEGNMLVADYSQFKDISPATHLVDITAKYAGELSCLANNVANSLQGSDFFKNRALENDRATSVNEMRDSLDLGQKAQQYVEMPLMFKEPTSQAINEYVIWLEKLYGRGLLSQYKITEIITKTSK